MPPVAEPERKVSALPSARARMLAFVAIVVAGLAGGLIGWAFADIECTGDCATQTGIGAVVGGTMAAGGVAVVAVLGLRAMGEWRRIQDEGASDSSRNPSA